MLTGDCITLTCVSLVFAEKEEDVLILDQTTFAHQELEVRRAFGYAHVEKCIMYTRIGASIIFSLIQFLGV